jgi:uncharacterized protein YecE (DUF72 family)
MIKWRIGCSGYLYPEWKGLFYPPGLPQKKWFEFYTEHFNTIELNTTFYRFPRVDTLRSWYNRCPADFVFSVKAPRVITHFKIFKEAQKYVADFYHAVDQGLLEKAGRVLFQFPENFHFDNERLDRIIGLLDFSFQNVLEFRHVSWWSSSVRETLSSHRVIFSGASHPTLPTNVEVTTDSLYYRLHGVPHLYSSNYPVEELELLAQQILNETNVRDAYIYFNNTASGCAVINARQFQGLTELVH